MTQWKARAVILPDGLKDANCALSVLTIAHAENAASLEVAETVPVEKLADMGALVVAVGFWDIAASVNNATVIVMKVVTRMLWNFFHQRESRVLGSRYI